MAASTSLGPVCSAITRVHTYRCGALLPMEAKLSDFRLCEIRYLSGMLVFRSARTSRTVSVRP